MKKFALLTPTTVKLTHAAFRAEMHGKNTVHAGDLSFELKTANTLLDEIKPGLREALYMAATDSDPNPTPELEGIPPISATPLLRMEGLEPIRLKDEYSGYSLTFDIGTGRKESLIELEGVKIGKLVVDMLQGGTVSLSFRAQVSGLKEREAGKLVMLMNTETSIVMVPPSLTDPIDGMVGQPGEETKNTAADAQADVDFRVTGGKSSVKTEMARQAAKKAAAAAAKKKAGR